LFFPFYTSILASFLGSDLKTARIIIYSSSDSEVQDLSDKLGLIFYSKNPVPTQDAIAPNEYFKTTEDLILENFSDFIS